MPTRDDVFAAADELDRSGARVSARAIRDRTGGSFRDLVPLVRAWNEEKAASAAAREQVVEVPPDVRDLLARAAVEAWKHARRHADAEAAQLRQQIRALEEAADASAEDADALAKEVEAAIVGLNAQIDELSGKNEALAVDLAAARDALARAETRAEAAERRADEADMRAKEQFEKLEAVFSVLPQATTSSTPKRKRRQPASSQPTADGEG